MSAGNEFHATGPEKLKLLVCMQLPMIVILIVGL